MDQKSKRQSGIGKTLATLNMNCREASILLANAGELKLTRPERWGLWIHLLICGTCRQFRAQIRFLSQLMAAAPKEFMEIGFAQCTRLSTQRVTQIKDLLRQATEEE
ncbi:anti-sigma factor family protein [Bythopirellula polymerisocia]|uniref:Zinc-finger domain-containing protein n=1 Tax=Bythopirellula polymerisocia TaxID=2528003 RepID=A0A5C6CKY1_9BACT|nr:hypothetical protein [Bythopirellula polymerisocia]TWU23786.1 hypothetical protein Pla144_39610 [Bythopirellula polymerisocia]